MVYINNKKIIPFPNQCDNIALLSPNMYWFVQKSFPFDNKRKIEKIVLKSAKSSFENANAVFSYKVDSTYFCFCYDKKSLEKLFEENHLSIEKIYFATSLLKNDSISLQVSESLFLNPLGGTFFESHQAFKPHSELLTCQHLEEREHIRIVKNNHSTLFTAILALLVVGFVLNLISWSIDFAAIEKQSSAFTLDGYRTQALIDRYENTKKTQELLRTSISNAESFIQLNCKGSACETK